MLIEDKTVYQGEYLSIKERITDINPDKPYTFLHEEKCNGKIVVILPFRRNAKGELEYLIRKERVINWDPENDVTESVTGGVENNDPDKTAVMELKEETGYDMPFSKFIPIGATKIAKHADTDAHMYAIDLTGVVRDQDYGDGSDGERRAYSYWYSNIADVESCIIYKIIYRLFEMGIINPNEYFGRMTQKEQPEQIAPVVKSINVPNNIKL